MKVIIWKIIDVLCYFLGSNKKNREISSKIAKKYDAKVLSFPYIVGNKFRFCDKKFGDIRDFSSGPKEFLGLIKNAEFVCTDSFHAVVFSIVFHKNFLAFPRYKKGSGASNNRLTDFLSELNLIDHMFESGGDLDIKLIDYDEVDKVVSKMRKESISWFKQAFGDMVENKQNGKS